MSSLKGQLSNVEGSVKTMKGAVVVGSDLAFAIDISLTEYKSRDFFPTNKFFSEIFCRVALKMRYLHAPLMRDILWLEPISWIWAVDFEPQICTREKREREREERERVKEKILVNEET